MHLLSLRSLHCTGFVFAVCTLLAGCAPTPEDQPDIASVKGLVVMDGEPVEGAVVTFAPASGRPSTGITDSQGKFELAYNPENKGAKIGKHTVRISTQRYVENADGTTTEMKETIPAKYNTESTLTVEVKAGENDFPFALDKE
ncbi:Bacterial Ig-like domain (group 1) [Gimesia panareensis]|uniref:Bacterial Ig-like domain (Group 1) n=1 Tax=Gimesia panareensis TaxID=2527978 RepID=A0A518FXI5_9PLAN|nr:carboxypeptidase-like regulatory domain-containing protein [Gimesia panareensis]QDV21021.1 Bacterial Ig-like domain (group 1) [Gimesia panareensis]